MAKKYLTIDGKLVLHNGKLIQADFTGASEDLTDLVDEQTTHVNQSTELTTELKNLINNGVVIKSFNPVEISTEAEMDALLVGNNIGKIYKFVGTSLKYITNAIYIVEEN